MRCPGRAGASFSGGPLVLAVLLVLSAATARAQFDADEPNACVPSARDPKGRAHLNCEDKVAKSLARLVAGVAICHQKQADIAFKAHGGKSVTFDEEACEGATKAKVEAALGKLRTSGMCDAQVLTNASQLEDSLLGRADTLGFLDAASDATHCDSASGALIDASGDEAGWVPSSKNGVKCSDTVGNALGKLFGALVHCHIKTADATFRGTAFEEQTCEQKALSAYDAAVAALDTRSLCPACLNTALRSALRDTVHHRVDQDSEVIYPCPCANGVIEPGTVCDAAASPNGCPAGQACIVQNHQCACAPSCNAQPPTDDTIQAAVRAALPGLVDPWRNPDEFVRLFSRVESHLGCSLGDSPAQAAAGRTDSLQTSADATPLCTDRVLCENFYQSIVNYCGPGNSCTNSQLSLNDVGDCLNQACFEHDQCSTQRCVGRFCDFTDQTEDCDPALFAACSNCVGVLTGAGRVTCAIMTELKYDDFDCSSPLTELLRLFPQARAIARALQAYADLCEGNALRHAVCAGQPSCSSDEACDPSTGMCVPPIQCCFSDGSCGHTSADVCACSGGITLAPGTCTPNPCPVPCCRIDGVCVMEVACPDVQQAGATCTPNPCSTTTTTTSTTTTTTLPLCGNGVLDSGEQCDASAPSGDAACPGQCWPTGQPDECTCPAPCCMSNGNCQITHDQGGPLSQSQCATAGGTTLTGLPPGNTCSPNPCPPTQCCLYPGGSTNGVCKLESPEACVADSGYNFGSGTCTTPNPCPCPANYVRDPPGTGTCVPLGACCQADGSCAAVSVAQGLGYCLGTGGYLFISSGLCTYNPCPPNECIPLPEVYCDAFLGKPEICPCNCADHLCTTAALGQDTCFKGTSCGTSGNPACTGWCRGICCDGSLPGCISPSSCPSTVAGPGVCINGLCQ